VLAVSGGRTVTVESEDADLYAAIDRVADRMGQAVSRALARERTSAWEPMQVG
jgi:ribosome-associated translation inhibitor RaiA